MTGLEVGTLKTMQTTGIWPHKTECIRNPDSGLNNKNHKYVYDLKLGTYCPMQARSNNRR